MCAYVYICEIYNGDEYLERKHAVVGVENDYDDDDDDELYHMFVAVV